MKVNINQIRRITPRWLIFVIDISICLVSIVFAYYLRFNFRIPEKELGFMPYAILVVIFVRALSFIIGRTYAGMVRHTGSRDIIRIFIALVIGSCIFIGVNIISYSYNQNFLIPISIIIIDFLITAFILSFSRLLVKIIYLEFNNIRKDSQSILIYGTSESAIITKQTIERNTKTPSRVIGFIDHHQRVPGNKIGGIIVYHLSELDKLLERKEVDTLIIAEHNLPGLRKQSVVDSCLTNGVEVKTIPDVSLWINGELSLNQLKSVKIEDLLERPEIKMDKQGIRKNLINKTILVTGAAGSIGSEIVRQLTKLNPKKIIIVDISESPLYDLQLELTEKLRFNAFEIIVSDVRCKLKMQNIFKKFKPSFVYHAAAYKHVPLMEENPGEAIRTNVIGTKITVDLSIEFGVKKFVMVSTDKAVNPTNVMGASKRIAELYIQSLQPNSETIFITTRFGNVLGSNGSVIPRFRKQIENGGPITITHPEVTRYFMTIPEACQLVLEAGNMGEGGEIFIFEMGKSVKIINLAKKMIKLSGLQTGKDIQIKYTGLRPGEKLYEELLSKCENTVPTYHPQIMIAKVDAVDSNIITKSIGELANLSDENDQFAIVRKMKEIVPEFKSKNSVYEVLDN